jgi:circadian clock protein KaiB
VSESTRVLLVEDQPGEARLMRSGLSDRLRALANELGFLNAGPRDVVELHAGALRSRIESVTPQRAQAYVEEARVVVLELMGYLVAYYRTSRTESRRVHGGRSPMAKYVLKLYITGRTPRSERAIANLRRIVDAAPASEYELTVVDVLEQPHLAEQDRVLVTPTLIKQMPPPPRRVLGDLSDVDLVASGLRLPGGRRGRDGLGARA